MGALRAGKLGTVALQSKSLDALLLLCRFPISKAATKASKAVGKE